MKGKKIITVLLVVCLLSVVLSVSAFATVTDSSGDGFALYNGVKLPNIDSVWTDKATYPYAAIAYGIAEEDGSHVYMFIASSVPLVYINAMELVFTADMSSYPCYLYDPNGVSEIPDAQNNWVYYLDNGGIGNVPIWTSADMESGSYGLEGVVSDGNIYLSASNPISLNGMNVIEWDGDTTGLVEFESYYKVSNDILTVSDFENSIIVENAYGSLVVLQPTTEDIIDYSHMGLVMCGGVSSLDDSNVSTDSGLYFVSAEEPEGLYRTVLIAYRPVEAPPDEGGGDDDDPQPPCGG